MGLFRIIALTCALAPLMLVTAASGGSAAAIEPEVERHYESGKQALEDQRPEDALGHFKKALANADGAAGSTWQMLLAVGLTYRDLEQPIFAMEYFRRFLAVTEKHREVMTQKWRSRRETVSKTLAEMEPEIAKNHGFVMVSSTPEGAAVSVSGTRAGADADASTPFSLVLPVGEHSIIVSLEGYEDTTHTVTVSPGALLDASLALNAIAPEPAAAPPAPVTVAATSEGSGGSVAPWIVLGTAGALLIGGGAMTGVAAGHASTLDELSGSPDPGPVSGNAKQAEWEDSKAGLETSQLVAGVLYGVGAATAAVGVLWLLLAGDDGPEGANVSVTPTSGGLYGHATWRF